jgi:hypothetical protein
MGKTVSLRTDGFSVWYGFCKKAARCARQPRLFYTDTPHPYKINGVLYKDKNGLPNDRRLRADGFIIRTQSTIRTDRSFVRVGFAH